MYKMVVFAGTTEGYEISRWLAKREVSVTVCVATEYGAHSLEESQYLKVAAGRMDEEKMEAFLREAAPDLVIDATHPYAVEVTRNIQDACQKTGYPYRRLLRRAQKAGEEVVCVDSVEEAVAYLNETKGNILLTTGSKELGKFVKLDHYQERLYARVLSLPSVMEACARLGVEGKHLIGMQGPFSTEMNLAMLRQYDCRYLVTKDTGAAGGFLQKAQAAMEAGAALVVIGRPAETVPGLSMEEMKRELLREFSLKNLRRVTLLGIGMGNPRTMTVEGKEACQRADLIIGAKRMVQTAAHPGQAVFEEYRVEEICRYLQEHPEYDQVVVALSGDVGFYSGAKKLADRLQEFGQVEILSGISSVVYFMAKLGLSWDDAKIVSAHGQDCNLVSLIKSHPKVFAILGRESSVRELARKLTDYGMGEVLLSVGERLSYEDEKIVTRKACQLTDYQGDPLSVICARNPEVCMPGATHGLPDEAFIRGKAPMTKEEVRCVSLGKLRLFEDSICYDVGAGTGSVSVEMALRVPDGKVYAIEKKPEAVELIRENKKKFALDHLEVVEGTAPEAMEDLEAPTHAFIGGSSGNLREIVTSLIRKNPKVRMVINCITLETVTEVLTLIQEKKLCCTDLVQISAARSRNLGRYHMMMGENPIYVITCSKGGEE